MAGRGVPWWLVATAAVAAVAVPMPSTHRPGGIIRAQVPASPRAGDQIDRWITAADLVDTRRDYSARDRAALRILIVGESSGRVDPPPNPVPNKCGVPRGLTQLCPSTYREHAPPGCGPADILVPACNIAAAVDWAIYRWDSVEATPGVREVLAGGDYHTGY